MNLIEGAYDLHVHAGPDVLPRCGDDFDIAQRIVESGMAGYVIKNHYVSTGYRAYLVNKAYPKCQAFGAIVLNNSVGGINPVAVEMAAREGIKIVWMPTTDGATEQHHVFYETPPEKQPYWARLVLKMRDDGIVFPGISILDQDGQLTENTLQVLDVIAKHDLILETGHLSRPETDALIKTAAERGVKKIIMTHVNFPGTYYSIEEQKKYIDYGAYMEFSYTPWQSGKISFEECVKMIKAVGADHVTMGTDLGRRDNVFPDEGMKIFSEKLFEAGLSEKEVRTINRENARKLLGV